MVQSGGNKVIRFCNSSGVRGAEPKRRCEVELKCLFNTFASALIDRLRIRMEKMMNSLPQFFKLTGRQSFLIKTSFYFLDLRFYLVTHFAKFTPHISRIRFCFVSKVSELVLFFLQLANVFGIKPLCRWAHDFDPA